MGLAARQGRFRAGLPLRPWAVLSAVVFCIACTVPAAGHGFHNAALTTRSLDEWLADVKQAVPNLDLGGGTAEMRSGRGLSALKAEAAKAAQARKPTGLMFRGSIETRYTPQQQALLARKANDCLEILAYMDPKNIYPTEFPNFQLSKIPHYQQAAKQLLRAMGPEGTRQVAGRIRQELMRGVPSGRDVELRDHYYDDLIEVLAEGVTAGNLNGQELQDLKDATEGAKDPAQQGLADRVRATISPENMDFASLAEWASKPMDAALKQRVLQALRERISKASVLELLNAEATVSDPAVRRKVETELSGRTPTYAELKDELPQIWQLAGAEDRKLATAARDQVVVAFQRAPMSHCLYWLGQADPQLAALIWQQIDARIQRADEARRGGYGRSALEVLGDNEFNVQSRKAAIGLLDRLKDRRATKDVVAGLLEMPRELWPSAGKLLRELTGQDFGPHEGDGIADVVEATKKWQAWLREKGQ